ncbi:MAG: hypothetical protein OXT03_00785, partial [Alphaproteobacteria bacterium]|nr:hypothetical protein [Alphaproteobacteria bacterium]
MGNINTATCPPRATRTVKPKVKHTVTRTAKCAKRVGKPFIEGDNYRFYDKSCMNMPQLDDESIALTITSPPYWNAIDYDIHTKQGKEAWHRERAYQSFGETF